MGVFGATDPDRLRDPKQAAPLAARSDPMPETASAHGFLARLG